MNTQDVLLKLHANLPRQGPGDAESTRRAWSYLEDLPTPTRLLDEGCGSGAQTLELARLMDGPITAIDVHEPYLKRLRNDAERQGLASRIDARNLSMFEMDFDPDSFDVIWSEGAIYIYGFEDAVRDWRPMLSAGGYLVCSHLCWLTDSVPEEAADFWNAEFPAMATVSENKQTIAEAGYIPVADFQLPAQSWWANYYEPLEDRVETLREKYAGEPEAQEIVEATQREIDLFCCYSDSYGYVFYVARSGKKHQ
jgi:SAM-dependent methyltransferase